MRLLIKRASVPGCDSGCRAYEENTDHDFVKRTICRVCPWDREPSTLQSEYLLQYAQLLEAGCPVGRWELSNQEWLLVGLIRREFFMPREVRHG